MPVNINTSEKSMHYQYIRNKMHSRIQKVLNLCVKSLQKPTLRLTLFDMRWKTETFYTFCRTFDN